jgi:hypothetical protein
VHPLSQDECYHKGISLAAKFYSTSDFDRNAIKIGKVRYHFPALRERKYESSYLHFTPVQANRSSADTLMSVNVITDLEINATNKRHLWPPTYSEIAAKLPCLI